MKDKPQFGGMHPGKDFRDDTPGLFTVVAIRSDGQNFFIDISEMCIPSFTPEVLEKLQYVLTDAIYRVRPDLRKQ